MTLKFWIRKKPKGGVEMSHKLAENCAQQMDNYYSPSLYLIQRFFDQPTHGYIGLVVIPC